MEHQCDLTIRTWGLLFALALVVVLGSMGGSWALMSKQLDSGKETAKAQADRMEQMFATAQSRREEMINGLHDIQRDQITGFGKLMVRMSDIPKPPDVAPVVIASPIEPTPSK